jgi:predicted Fe-S protein YdhL (DUF1289 family)
VEIITRKQAIEQGLKRYFTGKPCKRGHVDERYVTRGCIACLNIESARWKAINPEKARQVIYRNSQKFFCRKYYLDYSKRAEITDTRRAIEGRLEMKKLDQSINLS